MMVAMDRMATEVASFQHTFHQRWNFLKDPHVRALAWLLDAPDLLDTEAPRWQGRIASLGPDAAIAVKDWLLALEREPAELHAYLNVHRFTRLGRYAENLLAWYFTHVQRLVAHGVQVRSGKEETIGEFDFLLRDKEGGQGLLHWELATKFYLLCSANPAYAKVQTADYFVGPNLADTLGAKMRKILQRQLLLGEHLAAQSVLPEPLSRAQALVKGWLFYRREEPVDPKTLGISAHHCRGWWCTFSELEEHIGDHAVVMPRLAWLAPARLPASESMNAKAMRGWLERQFSEDLMPVMVATLQPSGDEMLEIDRGFVVPDDWMQRADQKLRGLSAPLN